MAKRPSALFKDWSSETLLESLERIRRFDGLMIKTTATEITARMPRTTRSSSRVKEERLETNDIFLVSQREGWLDKLYLEPCPYEHIFSILFCGVILF